MTRLPMNYCDKFKESFSGYIEGELPQDARQVLESHLSACPRCRETVHRMRNLRHTLTGLSRLTTSPDFEFKLGQRLQQVNTRSIERLPLNYFQSWKVPAVAFVLVMAAFSVFFFFGDTPREVNLRPAQKSSLTPTLMGDDKPENQAGNPQPALPSAAESLPENDSQPAITRPANVLPDSVQKKTLKNLNDSIHLINKQGNNK